MAAALLVLLSTPTPASAAEKGCDLSLTFFPEGTTNEPASLTKAGQMALKPPNKDDDQLLTVPVYGKTVPLVHVAPVSPLTTLGGCVPASCLPGKGRRRRLQQSCPRTLAPAQYRVSYSFEGSPPAVAGPYAATDPAPQIAVSEIAQMPPGTWCADIAVALVPETARVTQYSAGFLPAKDQYTKRTICFLKKAGTAPAGGAAAVPAAAAEEEEAVAEEPVAEEEAIEDAAAATDEPDLLPPPILKKGAGATGDDPKNLTAPSEPLDEAKLAQASRYYCLRYWSLGGKDAAKVQVPVGDEGTTACADACNSKGPSCQGFKVAGGTNCILMAAITPGGGKSDAAVSAACVKNQTDWLAVAKTTAGAGYYCLPNYDLAGDQAGAPTATSAEAGPPPPRPPGGLAKPEVATTSILLCAEQCRLFEGGSCQFFVQQSGICYLKSNMIGGAFGTTGPSNTTLNTCIQGSETWTLFGGQLDYLLPPPTADRLEAESTGGLLAGLGGGAAAGATAAGAAAALGGNATYYCIREYVVNGTLVRSGPVSNAGTDDSVVACAAECDKLGTQCAAHITTQTGVCGLYSGIKPRTTGTGDPTIQQLCVRSPVDWDALGDAGEDGSHCLNKYDIAGDGVKDTPYLGNTGGAAVAEFCKAQCRQEPKCEFVVASAGKCYLKNQLLVGSFGRTGYSETATKACVRSPSAWMTMANMVSAGGKGATGAFNGTGAAQLAARRAAAKAANGAGGGGGGGGLGGGAAGLALFVAAALVV